MVKTRASTKREKERNIERCMNKEIIEIEEMGRPRKFLVISNMVENKESGNMEMNPKLRLEARPNGKNGEINGDPVSTEEDNEVVSRMKTARDKLQHLLYVTQCQIQSINAIEFAVFAKLPYGETKLEPQFQGGIGDEVEAYLALPGCSASMAAPQLGSENAGENREGRE